MDDTVPPKLFSCLSSAADIVRAHDNVRIFSHQDADGISAAIILAKTMIRAGRGFGLTLLSGLNNETFEQIKNCGADCMIIADMGVSYLKELDEMDADIVVLDHHKGDDVPLKRVRHVNPHSFGMDGMTAGCGASLAMMFSVALDNNNWDLVQIAFAGIVGDKQHRKGLTGINEYLFREGNKRGYVTGTDGSFIPSGQLMSSLFLSVDPYIRGVSGNAEGVDSLLNDAGVDKTKSSHELSDAEKRKLSSLIAAKLLAQGTTKETFEDMASVKYVLRNWSTDAERLASVLDSCGRSGLGGAGIGFGLGDMKCSSEAAAADEGSRGKMVSSVAELDSKGLEQMENIQFFETSSGSAGIMCEAAMRFFGNANKPAVSYNISKDTAKASARCTHELLRMGADLSAAMRVAGESVGGGGGGHKIASGAWFPSGKEKEFLKILDRVIGEQISAK